MVRSMSVNGVEVYSVEHSVLLESQFIQRAYLRENSCHYPVTGICSVSIHTLIWILPVWKEVIEVPGPQGRTDD